MAVGLYIRLKILETPAFAQLQERQKVVQVPVRRTDPRPRQEYPAWPRGALYRGRDIQHLRRLHHRLSHRSSELPRQTALAGVMIASAIMIVMLPIYGNLSDRYGRRRLFAYGGALDRAAVFPSFWLMETKLPILVWLAIAIPFAFVYPAVYGPQAALFAELFDTRVRYTRHFLRLSVLRDLRERPDARSSPRRSCRWGATSPG